MSRSPKPSFAGERLGSRCEANAVERIVRTLDSLRAAKGISKAELARAIAAHPESVRRLLAKVSPNPTLATIVSLAEALGYRLELVRGTSTKRPGASPGGGRMPRPNRRGGS